MYLEITSKSDDKTVFVYIDGDLTTTSSPDAETDINRILENEPNKNVVINVEKVDFIASTGLRVILALGKRLNGQGKKLGVCAMNETTKSVFNMSGFSRIFPVFDTEDEARSAL